MELTPQQETELRAYIDGAIAELESARALLDEVAGSVTRWSRTGVANNPTYSNDDLTVGATAAHIVPVDIASAEGGEFAFNVVSNGGGYIGFGVVSDGQSIALPPINLASVPEGLWLWRDDRWKANAGGSSLHGSVGFATGDKVNMRLVGGALEFGVNDVWNGSPAYSSIVGLVRPCVVFFGLQSGVPASTATIQSGTWA